MSQLASVLAFDLGASSGRALIGAVEGDRLTITEVHRFANDPVQVGDHLHWDILRLLYEIKQGILKARHQGFTNIQSLGIDSWAVDFGLLSQSGELIGNPYHYRDHQTQGLLEEVGSLLGKDDIFTRTGLQFQPFNTIYQLYALKKAGSPLLQHADKLLMIPDLLRYFLTGEKHTEYTNATTTQLFNPSTKQWDEHLIQSLVIPRHIFLDPVQPGTFVGTLSASVCEELDVPAIPFIAVGEHDTASAVAAVPAFNQDFAYLSCGTWSLIGTELPYPVLSEQALQWNFTNEGGINHTYRLLKNIMGLWLIQECKRVWEKEGNSVTYEQLVNLAQQAKPFQCFIDPDNAMFLSPLHMPKQIQSYCQASGQYVPETEGELFRCIMESLALKYRMALEQTEKLSNKSFPGLHMVGGGINNHTLCQFTANAIGRTVWAGPTEGSGIGNVIVQLMALKLLPSIAEARKLVRNSFPIQTYIPQDTEEWKQSYIKFCKIIEL